ncbi:MAG: hypothetical protein IPJ55_06540 [Chloracidobacterium sp.]|nr:hypothetical protein [Chloracidobacterium sp.]
MTFRIHRILTPTDWSGKHPPCKVRTGSDSRRPVCNPDEAKSLQFASVGVEFVGTPNRREVGSNRSYPFLIAAKLLPNFSK